MGRPIHRPLSAACQWHVCLAGSDAARHGLSAAGCVIRHGLRAGTQAGRVRVAVVRTILASAIRGTD